MNSVYTFQTFHSLAQFPCRKKRIFFLKLLFVQTRTVVSLCMSTSDQSDALDVFSDTHSAHKGRPPVTI